MTFWITAALLTLVLAAFLLRAVIRRGAGLRSAAEADLGLYRDQLAEVARDAERGTISAAEAERSRIEISRRILDADRVLKDRGAGAARGPLLVPVFAVLALLGGAFWLYRDVGAPGYPDLPIADRIERAKVLRADRPSQAEAEAKATLPAAPAPDPAYAELLERLRKAVAANPNDLTGEQLLARNEAKVGNFAAAAQAQRKVIEIVGKNATADDYATLSDLYVLATGGYVSPEAEAAAGEALARDPKNGTARFYVGLMWAQTGRPDLAFEFWRALLEDGPEDAPWIAPIRDQIGMLASAAGVRYMPPPPPGAPMADTLKGPTTGDVAAAADMSTEDRMQMIRGMVGQLSDRLYSDGGSVEEWARLISSLGVLGDTEKAKEAWDKAQVAFAGQDDALSALRAAAEQAGIGG